MPGTRRTERSMRLLGAVSLALGGALIAVVSSVGGADAVVLGGGPSTTTAIPRGNVLWRETFKEDRVGGWKWDAGGGATTHAGVVSSDGGPRPGVLRVEASGDNDGNTGFGFDVRPSFDDLSVEAREDAWFRYKVYFPEDFDWYAGGKLPGLSGISAGDEAYSTSAGGEYRPTSWSGRLMWHPEGELTAYLYVKHADGVDVEDNVNHDNGRVYGISPYWHWGADPDQPRLTLRRGEWNVVDLHYRVNTPGLNDGVFEGWLNGEPGVRLTDVQYRTKDVPDLDINQVFLTSFFGGPTSNETNEEWFFDGLTLSVGPFRPARLGG